MSRKGVLPKQMLQELLDSGYIQNVDSTFLNPASIDLPLSGEAYRLESIFLPRQGGEHIRNLIQEVGGRPHDLTLPLEVGVPYIIRIAGKWKLPPNVYGYVNPKSSTGRLNLFSRGVADGADMYDHLPEGWTGEQWVLVHADSFPILLTKGQTIAQVRLFDGPSFLDELHIDFAIRNHGLLFLEDGQKLSSREIANHRDSLILTLRVSGECGWECRGTLKPLDFARKDHRESDFFDRVRAKDEGMLLRKGGFYILATAERVMVPPHLSAELRATDPRLGEFRSHAAGYIDPGWGYGSDGSVRGRPITLEVIPHEEMYVRHGQPIARIRYEHMKEAPDVPYDLVADSNYTEQGGPRLSKHFVYDD